MPWHAPIATSHQSPKATLLATLGRTRTRWLWRL